MLYGLMTLIRVSISFLSVILISTHATSQDDIFVTEHAINNDIVIDYEDLDHLLQTNVFFVGRSEHDFVRSPYANSAIRRGNQNPSRLEGNRVFFHALSDANMNYLSSIRWRLESIPEHIDFKLLTKNQQLTYWLNLHNITVYEHMARSYPIRRVKRFIFGSAGCIDFDCKDPTALLQKPTITIKGHTISLQDIQRHIFTNWSEPMVIYGLFLGAVGTPTIRPEAYRGNKIWEQLQDNAEEFVNSVRGTQTWYGKLHISEYYKRVAIMFPDFEVDVKKHLIQHADDKFRPRIERAKVIKPVIADWTTVDFLQGEPSGLGRYINLDARVGPPAHVRDFAHRVIKRLKKLYKPKVTVEEVAETEDTES